MMIQNVEVSKLSNGMTVITSRSDNVESVSMGIFVGVGSRFEKASEAGVSHFIEHMYFKGTEKRTAADLSRAIEGRGGYMNAATSEDVTYYYVRLPYEFLSEGVDVLTDMHLNAAFDPKEFDKEREVIIQEIMMYDDQPASIVQEKFQEALYQKHPLGASVSGSIRSLRAMTPDTLRAYQKRTYVPENTVFSFSGRLEHGRAVELVEKTLGTLPKGRLPKCRHVDATVRQLPLTIVRKDVNQLNAMLGFRIFGLHDDRKYAAQMLSAVLGGNMSSRLFQQVREKHGLCYTILSQTQFFQETGLFAIGAGFDVKKGIPALKLIAKELVRIADRKVGNAELQRAKDYITGLNRLSLEGTNVKMLLQGLGYLSYGRYVDPQEQIERMRAVTADDVRHVASQIFEPTRLSLALVVPQDDKRTDEEWLASLSELG